MPFLYEFLRMLTNDPFQFAEFRTTHTNIIHKLHRQQPELTRIFRTADMYVRRLVSLVAVEMKAKTLCACKS